MSAQGMMDYCLFTPKWEENLESNLAVVSFLCALHAFQRNNSELR